MATAGIWPVCCHPFFAGFRRVCRPVPCLIDSRSFQHQATRHRCMEGSRRKSWGRFSWSFLVRIIWQLNCSKWNDHQNRPRDFKCEAVTNRPDAAILQNNRNLQRKVAVFLFPLHFFEVCHLFCAGATLSHGGLQHNVLAVHLYYNAVSGPSFAILLIHEWIT